MSDGWDYGQNMKLKALVIPSGNATGVEVPAEIMKQLGPEARPPVTITINNHAWRSRIALMRGQILIGISAANRAAAHIAEGETIEIDLQPDREPRDIPLPPDLAEALTDQAKAAFDRLPFGLRRKYLTEIEQAKSPETRQHRIAKLNEQLWRKP